MDDAAGAAEPTEAASAAATSPGATTAPAAGAAAKSPPAADAASSSPASADAAPPAKKQRKKQATKPAKSAAALAQEIAALAAFADSDVIEPDDVLPSAEELDATVAAARSAFIINWTCRYVQPALRASAARCLDELQKLRSD
jgi:hypothetical protein